MNILKKVLVVGALLSALMVTNVQASPYPSGGIVVNPTEDMSDDICISSPKYVGHWSDYHSFNLRMDYWEWCHENDIFWTEEPLTWMDGSGNYWTLD